MSGFGKSKSQSKSQSKSKGSGHGGRGGSAGIDKSNDGRRVARVEKEVQGIVSTFIIQKIQSELPGLVTVGHVQIPADLRQARVYVSLLKFDQAQQQTPEDLEKAIEILQSWAPEIQDEISRKIQMKYLPKLTFFPDETTEKILKIENILSHLGPNERARLDDLDDDILANDDTIDTDTAHDDAANDNLTDDNESS